MLTGDAPLFDVVLDASEVETRAQVAPGSLLCCFGNSEADSGRHRSARYFTAAFQQRASTSDAIAGFDEACHVMSFSRSVTERERSVLISGTCANRSDTTRRRCLASMDPTGPDALPVSADSLLWRDRCCWHVASCPIECCRVSAAMVGKKRQARRRRAISMPRAARRQRQLVLPAYDVVD